MLKANPGLADYSYYPDEGDVLIWLFDTLDFSDDQELSIARGGLADFLAEFKVRETKAQAFLNEHPKAPRRWRTLANQKKNF